MRPGSCARLFEAEAMRDGRLGGAELASFGRHLTVCPVCLREVQALEALAEGLRAAPQDHGGEDQLRVQRQRTRLLAAFDRALFTPERRWSARRRLLWPAAAAAILTGLLVFWRGRPAEQPVPPSRVVVRADSTAVWSKRRNGGREEVALERGALWIQVEHARGRDRLVVMLPDGELEDIGTTFTVSAEHGHTTRVAVQEGSVVLRLRGQPPVAIGAGETWIPQARPPAAVQPSLAPPMLPAQPPPGRRLSRPARPARPAPAEPRPRAPAPVASVSLDPAGDFRVAVAMLEAGDNREAAAAFTRFLRRHPGDGRAEDAAYLRVIALQRSGASADTKRAAREYLQRYPTGFRRTEVERLAGAQDQVQDQVP
jgi:hypothetical protein